MRTYRRLKDAADRVLGLRGGYNSPGGIGIPPRVVAAGLAPDAPRMVLVFITGQLQGGAKYEGKILQGQILPENAATWITEDLALPETLFTPQDEDCYIVNLVENDESDHYLMFNQAKRFHLGLVIGACDDGKLIVAIESYGVNDCVVPP